MPESNTDDDEGSPLLGPQSTAAATAAATTSRVAVAVIGDASMFQTIINMAKTCMGTGCLVLPFAARRGGLLLHTVGLLVIATWNIYTVQRLCSCLQYIPIITAETSNSNNNGGDCDDGDGNNNNDDTYDNEQYTRARKGTKSAAPAAAPVPLPYKLYYTEHPPDETAMFGKVVFYAMGPRGLIVLDVLMVSFLLGILITYINAMRSFLRDTPITTGSAVVDAIGLIAIMGPMSCVPHMGYLARASATGLLVLVVTFVVLGMYGIDRYDEDHLSTKTTITSSLSWWPENGLWGVSHWFGCVVFSFGVAPLTYNFRSSLADPDQMVPATTYALMTVALIYMGLGIGFWIMFPSMQGDLLQELPQTGWLPVMTRLAMVVVVLTTAPLLIVPCGELIESKISHSVTRMMPFAASNHTTGDDDNQDHDDHHQFRRIVFRFGICFLGVGISLYVPGFVDVLSFVGCCCVACLGFCIPPLLHVLLCFQARRYRPWNKVTMMVDILMLAWGIFATVISTAYTFRQISIGNAR